MSCSPRPLGFLLSTSLSTARVSPFQNVSVTAFLITELDGAPLPLPAVLDSSLFKIGATDDLEVTSYAASLPKSAFPVLSHGDHPTLNIPCWYLHPCETASVIDELVREVREDGWDEETALVRWLELWFMVVSSVVNL
jgi:ubiquitin-like-conjugating enzyme ATG10